MRRWAFGAFAVVAGAAVGAACSSFDASEPGADADASTAEGGDSARPDLLDGAVLDGEASDAGWLPCANRPNDPAHFCDDFDDTGRIDKKWVTTSSDGGSVGETNASASAPRALVIHLVGGSGETKSILRSDRGAQVQVAAKQRLAVSFAMRVDKPPFPTDGGTGYMHVAVVELDPPSCASTPNLEQREIELSFFPNGTFGGALKGVRDLCPTDAGDFASLKTTSKLEDFAQGFRRVTLDVSHTPCTGAAGIAVRLSIEGVAEISCMSLGAGDPFKHGMTLTMQLGLFASGRWAEAAVAYDDVTVDFD